MLIGRSAPRPMHDTVGLAHSLGVPNSFLEKLHDRPGIVPALEHELVEVVEQQQVGVGELGPKHPLLVEHERLNFCLLLEIGQRPLVGVTPRSP